MQIDSRLVDVIATELLRFVDRLELFAWVKSLVLSARSALPDFCDLPETDQRDRVCEVLKYLGLKHTKHQVALKSDEIRSKCASGKSAELKEQRSAERDYAQMAGLSNQRDDGSGDDDASASEWEDEGDESDAEGSTEFADY